MADALKIPVPRDVRIKRTTESRFELGARVVLPSGLKAVVVGTGLGSGGRPRVTCRYVLKIRETVDLPEEFVKLDL